MSKFMPQARAAMKYVQGKMDIGASNKIGTGMIAKALCAGGTFNKGALRTEVDKELARLPEDEQNYKNYLQISANWAKFFGCGNCGEQSALAFVYLRDKGVRPLDWYQVDDFKHAFVIVGRAKGSDPLKWETWGWDAVMCDPWRNVVKEALFDAVYLKGKALGHLYAEA